MRILSKWLLRLFLTALIAGLALMVAASTSARSATINVDCSTGDILQDAILGAASGDTINIAAGTCTENITID